MVIVHILVDCRDAIRANMQYNGRDNGYEKIEELEFWVMLRIISNLAVHWASQR